MGVIDTLQACDRILTNHRSAARLLARGADPGCLMTEVLGRIDGYCGGRNGGDVTLVCYAKTVATCLHAAERLHAEGISAEVIDLRSLKPLDEAAVLQSVRKTGRLIIVHEASGLCGLAAEIAVLAATRAFDTLRAPVARITGPDAPSGASRALEQAALPQSETIVDAARGMMARRHPPSAANLHIA